MLWICVWIRVCVCIYMCMYKCMSMRMCTRYGLNDRDSYSSSRWDKPESQYKCVDNVSNHAVSMCKSLYVYLYVCISIWICVCVHGAVWVTVSRIPTLKPIAPRQLSRLVRLRRYCNHEGLRWQDPLTHGQTSKSLSNKRRYAVSVFPQDQEA